jgi:transposase
MLSIGCDYHPGFQQIAFVDQETGEFGERRLQHPEETQRFYRELHSQGKTVRVGMEASGHGRWFALQAMDRVGECRSIGTRPRICNWL